jgi:hypothetical protein
VPSAVANNNTLPSGDHSARHNRVPMSRDQMRLPVTTKKNCWDC